MTIRYLIITVAVAAGLLCVQSSSVSYAQETARSARMRTFSGGILNKRAIEKPNPIYPHTARVARVSGTVVVQIVVDQYGKVESAAAVKGHPLLRVAAVDAARQARFAPTRVSGQPVKVSGVLVYNFVRTRGVI